MVIKGLQRAALLQVGLEGALLTLAPAPFILATAMASGGEPSRWRLTAAAIASLAGLVAALLFLRRTGAGRLFAIIAVGATVVAAYPYLAADPGAALLGAVSVIGILFALKDFQVPMEEQRRSSPLDRSLQRAQWSAATLPVLVVAAVLVDSVRHGLADLALAGAVMVTLALVIHWLWRGTSGLRRLGWTTLSVLLAAGVISLLPVGQIRPAALAAGILTFMVLPRTVPGHGLHEQWWETLLNHPARVLLSTFLGLCVMGTVLLLLPGATARSISLLDAAFTSVSAVCVTGLIVLDTPNDFTLFGQALLLLLIQLGGLGIMTITTVALHVMGRRLSLRQERLMTSMTDTGHADLLASLITVLRFTCAAELAGAFALTALFVQAGDQFPAALWRGVFTSVSAFCNAGFALQSDSLIPYQGTPLILHVVALLIICGGLAPAACLAVPRWLAGRQVPLTMRLALGATVVLLAVGMLQFLVLEWEGIMTGLGIADKIHNAWFQSVTLRTAGFNSLDVSGVTAPVFLVMLGWMFIGGCPGGTAGGIKTTTVAVLVLTFWQSIAGREEVIVRNRRIPPGTVNRAITIVVSGLLLWFILVLMLAITQQIPVRDLIFEVTSALGTVGLSTGATARLDGIGKIIIMWAMFIGRIGPMTLFMLLSEERSSRISRCLDARITLT
ncbi:MAG: potassium transporter TrkG [Desulfobulbaceae bacterium]